jgi:RND family efflux transporter MFP subunit
MGTVTGANFAIGQNVPAGEVLLTIQADELNARLEQARAALDLATRDAKREAALFGQGASPEETVRSAEDRLRMARAAFNEATTLVGYTRVTAPFAGFVTRKLINTGDFADAGTPLLEIEARDRMRAEVEVPDALPSLPIGTAVRVIVSGATVAGRVAEASSAAQAPTRTRSVVIELPTGTSVHSGEFVRVLWPAGEFALLFVPTDAVQLFGQIERVFVVTGSRATMRFVKTGLRENERVQILSGLDSGETVVVSPPATLRDGHPVRVLP